MIINNIVHLKGHLLKKKKKIICFIKIGRIKKNNNNKELAEGTLLIVFCILFNHILIFLIFIN